MNEGLEDSVSIKGQKLLRAYKYRKIVQTSAGGRELNLRGETQA